MSTPLGTTRRHFLKTSLATAGTAALSRHLTLAQTPARYRRYNVTSPQGQQALVSYAKGIQAMLNLPPDNPQNWFRNAFIHLMDCPHGNWWFYVWHRGYLGYFEQTIRNLSGDPNFAIPYWDWTTTLSPSPKSQPVIPDSMFNGVLTPTDSAFAPYTSDIGTFTSFIKPSLQQYWNQLDEFQRSMLEARGYKVFEDMWDDVTGDGNPENMAFATTSNARYLTRANPYLAAGAAGNVQPRNVYSGLTPTSFYDPINFISFNSSQTHNHNTPPPAGHPEVFSTLEGLPHNTTHNCIGGAPQKAAPWGNMTNNLSPIDPIFFLHHSNMDRLWDVWTRKQQALNLPYLPKGSDFITYQIESFLFYVDGNGNTPPHATAGDYISTTRFQYDYEPGFGEAIVPSSSASRAAKHTIAPVKGLVHRNAATLKLSASAIRSHLENGDRPSLIALVTVPRPSAASPNREFDILVGAPSDATQARIDSPYYAGTVAFFGGMMHMHGMSDEATFLVPLPSHKEAFSGLGAGAATVDITIRAVPVGGGASVLKAATVHSL